VRLWSLHAGLTAAALLGAYPAVAGVDATSPLDAAQAERFARLALACVHREYPNKVAHTLNSDDDARPPRELTPAFYGCYDWHSSVHGHWLLARLARLFPDAPFARDARAALAQSLAPQAIAAEVRYLEGKGRVSFERPYGLAWLLQLGTEMREWADPEARAWSRALARLEAAAAARLEEWLPKLAYPIRVGEHSQTAFAFGLALDWARRSGEDFLSPCLAEADLLRRILAPPAFASWLTRFLPRLSGGGSATWLRPGLVTDRADPKLAHIDGLNLSRAWMLEGIAAGLPPADRRAAALQAAARAHRDAGLVGVTGEHYEGGHWLGTFAVYLLTRRGL